MPHNERHPNARTQQDTNRERVGRTHEAEAAIARRGAHTRDPRAVGTDPTRTNARRPRDTEPATPDA